MTAGYRSGLRNTQEDFELADYIAPGLSTERRPGALSFDYLVSFTMGPVANGDPSQGSYAWAWRIREVGNSVVVCRETDARDGWLPEVELFNYSGPAILELDFAFSQAGRPVVCAERATGPDGAKEVWLYWYNPFSAAYIFENLTDGRTPRVILDDPEDIDNADVLLFYISSGMGKIRYRVQREQYAAAHDTPVFSTENTFIEDVIKTVDNRVVVVYSILDPVAATYALDRLESTLYGFHVHDILRLVLTPLEGVLETALFEAGGVDSLVIGLSPIDSEILELNINIDLEEDSVSVGLAPLASTLTQLNIDILLDEEGVGPTLSPANSSLVVVLISHQVYDTPGVMTTITPLNSTLAVP